MQNFVMISIINTFVRFTSVFPDIFLVLLKQLQYVHALHQPLFNTSFKVSAKLKKCPITSFNFENNVTTFYNKKEPKGLYLCNVMCQAF